MVPFVLMVGWRKEVAVQSGVWVTPCDSISVHVSWLLTPGFSLTRLVDDAVRRVPSAEKQGRINREEQTDAFAFYH